MATYSTSAPDDVRPPLNRKALVAVVLAVTPIFGLGSILALVYGHKARREIAESQGRQGGRDMAEVAIALGWTGVGLALFVIPVLTVVSLAMRASFGG